MMAKLARLINGQDVTFDTHQAGDGQETHWRQVHLEKRLHGKRGKVRFPLFDGQPTKSGRISEEDFRRITNEVRRALRKDETVAEQLAKVIVDTLGRFSGGRATPEDCRIAAKRIAEFFGLEEEFLRVVEEYVHQHLVFFSTVHFNRDNGTLHEILLSASSVEIRRVRRYFPVDRLVPIGA